MTLQSVLTGQSVLTLREHSRRAQFLFAVSWPRLFTLFLPLLLNPSPPPGVKMLRFSTSFLPVYGNARAQTTPALTLAW